MKLWLLSQDKNNDYDTYDSCVVVAENEEDAKKFAPERMREEATAYLGQLIENYPQSRGQSVEP